MRTSSLTIRIDPKLRERLQAYAEAQRWSESTAASVAIEEMLKRADEAARKSKPAS